ncbi:MAG TPA: O-methyltransferase [Nitrososphaera sp.]|nr:O-methyltransferase [Nitrososphaera sp.]
MDSRQILRVISKLDKQSERERSGKVRVPRGSEMLAITADTGEFFSILMKAIKAKRALEVGTSVGFSTLWLAEAVGEKGKVVTIEMNPLKIKHAKENFERAGVSEIIEIRYGIALDVLRKLKARSRRFDFVLLDADKENIIEYFDLVLPMVRVGGIIAADNMLLPPRYRPFMKKYAQHVRSNPRVQSVTVPIGMGEEITIKLR